MNWNTRGELQETCFHDAQKNTIWKRNLVYDKRGNVLKETIVNATTRYKYNDPNLVIRMEEESGLVTGFGYLHDTPLVTVKLMGDGARIFRREFYHYNEDHIVTEEVTDNGSGLAKEDLSDVTVRLIKRMHLSHEYPALGYPIWIDELYWENGHEHLLKKTFLVYSTDCKVVRQDIYDAHGHFRYSLRTEYDSVGRPIEETDPLGRVVRTAYDAFGNKIRVEQPDKTTLMGYDLANRHISTEEIGFDGQRRRSQFRYNYVGDQTLSIDHFGNHTHVEYDAFHHPITIQTPDGSVVKKTYNALGHENSITDPNGHRTLKQLNHLGHPLNIHYPDGGTETFHYHASGTVKDSIDTRGTKTAYLYDVFGRVTQKTLINKQGEELVKESFSYDGFNLLSKTDGEGNLTTYTYDGAGRKIRETSTFNGREETIVYTYDSLNRLHSIQAEDILKIVEYDLIGQIIEEREEHTSGQILKKSAYAYDVAGNKTSVTHWTQEGEATTTILYDSFRRPIQSTNALGQVTRISYNDHFINDQGQKVQQITTTDPAGIQTIEVHDSQGRIVLLEKKNPNGETLSREAYRYDRVGNLTQQTSTIFTENDPPRQVVTAWKYGPMKRLMSIIEGAHTEDPKTTQFAYNHAGHRTRVIKPDGTIILYRHDPLGRVQEIQTSDHSIHTRFRYNRLHYPILCEDLLTGITIKRVYDAKGRLLEETIPSGTFKNSYDTIGRRQECRLPDQSRIRFIHSNGHLNTIERQNPNGETLYSHHYTNYDLSGHLLSQQLIGNLGTVTFTFDKLGRDTAIQSPYQTERIEQFDPAGNILARIFNQMRETYTYSDLNQLTTEPNHVYTYDSHHNRLSKDTLPYTIDPLNRLLEYDTTTFQYDPNGNPLTQSNTSPITYTYDALDRLTTIEYPDKERHIYTYDAFHRRLISQIYTWNSQTWILTNTYNFLYDDQNEIGSTDQTGTLQELRILGLGRGAEIGASIAIELQGQIYAPLHDLFGNITTLISLNTGTIAEAYHYTAFGEETLLTHTLNPWRYASKRTEGHLVFFGRRFYQPHLGRWLTPDPEGLAHNPNLYAYLLNAPLTHLDLYGLKEFKSLGTQIGNALNGISHGVVDFIVGSAHDLHTMLVYVGSDEMGMTLNEKVWMFNTVERSQASQMQAVADWMMDILPIDESDPVYQSFRSKTTMGLEIGSLIAGGYSFVKGAIAFNRLAKAPLQAAKLTKKLSSVERKGISLAGSRRAPLDYAPFQTIRNETTVINNRTYVGHALDRMQD